MIIKNGKIFDAVNEEPYIADILVEDGKIKQIGKDLNSANDEIIDAEGKNVYPGLIDAHSHVGLWGYGAAGKDTDLNERNDILNPHVKGIDGFDPFDEGLKRALFGGVTTLGAGPGSAAILRAKGDTKRPLYFLAISGLVKIIFSYIFVGIFKLGVRSIALSSVISYSLSAVLVILALMHEEGSSKLYLKKSEYMQQNSKEFSQWVFLLAYSHRCFLYQTY